jgi:hypothetical protein
MAWSAKISDFQFLLSFRSFKLFLDTLEEATKKTKGHVNMVA